MIRRSIIIFLLLFAAYSIFIRFNKKELPSDQYQYQTNIILVDRYIYAAKLPQKVILGSSLSAKIVADSIPGIYNLALHGMSIFDGFNVLSKRKDVPKVLFIEINELSRQESSQLKQELNSPESSFLKDNFPAIRAENQPVGVLKGLLAVRKKGSQATQDQPLDQKLFNELLAAQASGYSNPDIALINNSVIRLKHLVDDMQVKGTKVCFFEMPVNRKLLHLPYAEIIRKTIHQNFPANAFINIPATQYTTIDGLHLNLKESADYSHYFRTETDKIRE